MALFTGFKEVHLFVYLKEDKKPFMRNLNLHDFRVTGFKVKYKETRVNQNVSAEQSANLG